jgi:hypothetical protein
MKNMDRLVIEYQYFGSIDYYKTSINYSYFDIELYEKWEKGQFLNRCYLMGPNGPLLLSIPLEAGRGQKHLLKDVKISYRENWGWRHWRTIHDAYRRSPWFEYYAPTLEPLFKERPVYLMDFNRLTQEWVLAQLKWKGEMGQTKAFQEHYPLEGFADKRRAYEGAPVTTDYRYPQVFEDRHGFRGNLCILDLLFCEGPQALQFLNR